MLLLALAAGPGLTAALASNDGGGIDISVKAPQLKDRDIYVGQYLLGKLFTKDTIRMDAKGNGRLRRDEKFEEGMYVIYLSDSKYFDFLLGADQHFAVKIDTADIPRSVQITGKGETPAFFGYTMSLMKRQHAADSLNKLKEGQADSAVLERINAEIELLNAGHIKEKESLQKAYPNSMTTLFLKGLQVPGYDDGGRFDSLEKNVRDSLSALDRYMFYSRHYLDSLDMADPRTFRTPYILNSLDTYIDKVLVQHYDSIIPRAMDLIARSEANEECLRYTCSHFLSYAIKSNIMGMDRLLVELADNYYLNGKAAWADSALVAGMQKESEKVRRCLVGGPGHNLQLRDSLNAPVNVYDLGGEKFTVLFFYEPSCGHCRATTPEIVKFYDKHKDDPRIKVIAIYMLTDRKEWMDFVKEQKMQDLTNVWDPDRRSYYWHWYDTSSTPQIYVLDENKNIKVKRIDAKTLDLIAEHEL